MGKTYRWDGFVVDLEAFRLERDGVPLALEPKAFDLLALLVERPGRLFTKQEIFDAVWPGTAVSDHALTRIVAQLRRVLGDEARDARYIETVPTRGYRWLADVQVVEGVPPGPPAAAAVDAHPGHAEGRRGPFDVRVAFAAAAAVVLLAAIAWSQRARPGESIATVSHGKWPVQVTTNPGLDLHPAFSPHGDAIAYASDVTGSFEIYVRTLDGRATETALTSDRGHNVQPAWSPDGRLIAFHSHAHGGIWVMPARGGVAQQIAPEGSHPAWSPDGERIAFQSDEPVDATPGAFGAQSGSAIWIVDADGSNLRQLTRPDRPLGGHAAPAWSHGGRYLAFAVFEGGPANNGIWLLTLETLDTTRLHAGEALYEIVFTPDDSALYVAGGEPFVTRLPFDAASGQVNGPRAVIPVPGVPRLRGLTISPDGDTLAFSGLTVTSHLWEQAMDADGLPRGEAEQLTTDTSRRSSLPAISPDGTRVAYVSTRGGEQPRIWVIGIDGSGAMQVTSAAGADTQAVWRPDGRTLIVKSVRDGRPGLWAVDVATRREQLVIDGSRVGDRLRTAGGTVAETAVAPSANEMAIAVITPPHAHRQLFVSAIEPFAPRRLTDGSEWVGYPAWSPTDRRLAVEIKEGSSTNAGVVDIDTGRVRRLTNDRGQTWVRSWSPDGRRVAAAFFRRGLWDLRWIDAATGAQQIITAAVAPNVYVRYPEWSPRGDRLIFERGELHGNLWTLELAAPTLTR